MLKRNIRISYPAGRGRLVLRSEADWEKNIEAIQVSPDGTAYTFELSADRPFLYVDPCLIANNGAFHWAIGNSTLILMERENDQIFYPFFFDAEPGHFVELEELPSKLLGHSTPLCCYLPPGYYENTQAIYPVAFLYDTQQLLFPKEAFQPQALAPEHLDQILTTLSGVDDFIMVGISINDQELGIKSQEGYDAYAAALVKEIVPHIEEILRIEHNEKYRSVWGTDVGGVLAFNAAWNYANFFGGAVCMSCPFANLKGLMDQVLMNPKRNIDFYFDSQYKDDHQEETMAMAVALVSRGWKYGVNLFYQCFPKDSTKKDHWSVRMQLPIQFLTGVIATRARRNGDEELHKIKA